MTCAWPHSIPTPSPHGWCWSVPGAAGIEATSEAAEAKINRHRKTVRT